MQIGVIGWWGYDNQGDLAMLAALRKGLAPHHVVPIDTGFPAHPDTIYRLNRLDYVILGGGTLIPGKPTAPFDDFNHWADQLDTPLGVAGLGVDPFPEKHWPAVETLLNRAQFFHVRDRESRRLLREHPKVEVVPDLTFACPLSARDDISDDVKIIPMCGVNLRRSDLSSLDPAPWVDALEQLPVEVKGVPLSSFDAFDEEILLKQLDPTCPERFDEALYHQVDLMVGTAFHSILFAVQAAVPLIAINYAPKVRHFMTENGLTRYILAPDEHDRLAELVDELLTKRSKISADLLAIRRDLTREAQRSLEDIREQIERSGPRHQRSGPKVTVAVVGSGRVEEDQRTLASCAAQTYENVEVLFVSDDSQEGTVDRLQQALKQSSGECLTWVEGGDWFAEDAVDCLVNCLEQKLNWDVVYSDYYALSDKNLPVGLHTVPRPEKLYRRDVVGPCFLMRRKLLPILDEVTADTPLPSYSLWLQIRLNYKIVPFHAPLFYSSRPIRSGAFVAKEREIRRHWRQTEPLWKRVVWWVIDSDLGERLIVEPVAHLLRLWRRRSDAKRF
jgi:polysaccharide pyruvyl transferase WcaK-like protein